MTKNPDCIAQISEEDCNKMVVVHIESDSDVDRIHYIYDFTGKPSVLIAKADKNSTLTINWSKFLSSNSEESVVISPIASYVFANVIDNFVIFNDVHDTSNLSDPINTEITRINPHNINWTLVVLKESNGENATLEMKADYFNGSFVMRVSTFYVSSKI